MKIGTKVRWKSQASGNYKVKAGFIVAVVPDSEPPYKFIPPGMSLDSDSRRRSGESYLVQVGNSRNIYWPRVKHLIEEV